MIEIFNLDFCYNSISPSLCVWAVKFVIIFVIGFIIYKIITPKIKLR